MDPNWRYSLLITSYAAFSFWDWADPQPQVLLRLQQKETGNSSRVRWVEAHLGGLLGCFGDSLAANVEELQPEPGQGQRQNHGGEGEPKPRGEVDHVSVLREESETRRRVQR